MPGVTGATLVCLPSLGLAIPCKTTDCFSLTSFFHDFLFFSFNTMFIIPAVPTQRHKQDSQIHKNEVETLKIGRLSNTAIDSNQLPIVVVTSLPEKSRSTDEAVTHHRTCVPTWPFVGSQFPSLVTLPFLFFLICLW